MRDQPLRTHPSLYARSATLSFILLIASCSSSSSSGGGFQQTSAPAPLTEAPSDAAWTFQLQTAGATGPVQYSLLQGPAGLAVDANGLVSWAPSLNDLGTSTIRIEADDGATTVEFMWDLRVHQDLLLGTAYSPIGHQGSVTNPGGVAYLTNRQHGRVVGYHTNWRDPGVDTAVIPGLVHSAMAARTQFGVQPTLVIGWAAGDGTQDLTSDSEPGNNTWTNAETRAEFRDVFVQIAQTYQPQYLALANEMNIWYATNQADLPNWLTLYSEVYDAIKVVSPDTRVYATFQLEFLKGEGINWPHGDTWTVFDQMNATGRLDVAAFTSYPYFEYATPAVIPLNHYDEIFMHWATGEVVFTEIGWLAAPNFPYPGSEADQAAFIPRFFELTANFDLEFVQYLFMHDVDIEAMFPPFVSVGLRSNDGTLIRTADTAWRGAVALRER